MMWRVDAVAANMGAMAAMASSKWRNRPPVSLMTTLCQELGCHSKNFLQGKTSLPEAKI